MGKGFGRPGIRALFLFLVLALACVGSASATDSTPAAPPAKTCVRGQYLDQFGECQDWCKKPFTGGASFFSGELVPVRFCQKPGGLTIKGENNTDNRPGCWVYVGKQTDSWWSGTLKVEGYSIYTNPRDICGDGENEQQLGKKICDKLGCSRVEGSEDRPSGISANGTPSPVYSGNNSTQISATQQCTWDAATQSYKNCAQTAGGTVMGNTGSNYAGTPSATAGAAGVSKEFCERYGYSYTGMCQYSATPPYMTPSSSPPQQANENSVKYFPSPDDVNCNWSYNSTTKNYQINSGTCRGYFLPPYDPAAHAQACKLTANSAYSGPNSEGYNSSSSSPYKACLLSNQYDRQRPKVNATWVTTESGSKTVEFNYEWYSCEYVNTKSASTMDYQYKGTGSMCTQLGSLSGDTASQEPPYEYRPASDDFMCENGKPNTAWSTAKCNGQYVPFGISDRESKMFFGGAAEGYVRFRNGTTEVIPGNGNDVRGLDEDYVYDPQILGGDPSVGVKYGAGAGNGGGGGGSIPSLEANSEMPSSTFDPWYEPEYRDGPVGVWKARSETLTNSALGQWVKGFEISGGSSFNPVWHLDFTALRLGVLELSIPSELMIALRYLVLISAVFAVRKIVFGG